MAEILGMTLFATLCFVAALLACVAVVGAVQNISAWFGERKWPNG